MEIDEWAIGQRIASHRVRRGLTQEELAGLVGISLCPQHTSSPWLWAA